MGSWHADLEEACAENTKMSSRFGAYEAVSESSFWIFSVGFQLKRALDMTSYRDVVTAVRRLGVQKAWPEAVALFQQAAHRRSSKKWCLLLHNAALEACERSQQWRCATEVLDSMGRRRLQADLACFNALIACFSGLERGERSLQILQQMRLKSLQADARSYTSAASALQLHSRWEEALLLASHEMSSPFVVSVAVSACEKGSHWQLAVELLRLKPSVPAYGAAISACGYAKEWRTALALLQELVRHRGGVELLPSWGAAIAACGRQRLWRQTLALLEQLRDLTLEPNRWILRGVAWSLRKAGHRRPQLSDEQSDPVGDRLALFCGAWELALAECLELLDRDPGGAEAACAEALPQLQGRRAVELRWAMALRGLRVRRGEVQRPPHGVLHALRVGGVPKGLVLRDPVLEQQISWCADTALTALGLRKLGRVVPRFTSKGDLKGLEKLQKAVRSSAKEELVP